MKNLLFANGFKTMVLLVLLSFAFGCEKDKEIEPLKDSAQLTDTTSNVPDLIGRNKSIQYCYIRNRWKPDLYLCAGYLSSFPDGEYIPVTYSKFYDIYSGYGDAPFKWELKNLPHYPNEGFLYSLRQTLYGGYLTDYYLYEYPCIKYVNSESLYTNWNLELVYDKAENYYIIRNCISLDYLNIQNLTGYVECTSIDKKMWSAQWQFVFL